MQCVGVWLYVSGMILLYSGCELSLAIYIFKLIINVWQIIKNGIYEKLNKRKIETYNRFNRTCMAENHKTVQVLVWTKYVPQSAS